MSYSLSFAEDFFIGDPYGTIGETNIRDCYVVTRRPQSVLQALVSEAKLAPARFAVMVHEVLGYSPVGDLPLDDTVFIDLLDKIKEYDICDTLTSPIQVYANKDHYVTVYEDIENEVA